MNFSRKHIAHSEAVGGIDTGAGHGTGVGIGTGIGIDTQPVTIERNLRLNLR